MSPGQSPKYAGTLPLTCVQYTRRRLWSTSSTTQTCPAMAIFSPAGGGCTMVPISCDSLRTVYSSFSWNTA